MPTTCRRGCVKSRKWHAPKGQKLLAQGSALGVMHPKAKRPVRAKALKSAFALTGRIIYNVRLPRAMPWARRNLGFQPAFIQVKLYVHYTNYTLYVHYTNHTLYVHYTNPDIIRSLYVLFAKPWATCPHGRRTL